MRHPISEDTLIRTAELIKVLDCLGLSHWHPILESWLSHFDGWRSVYLQDDSIVEDDAPMGQVSELLARYVYDGRRPNDMEFADDLARLDFLTWRARHERPGSRWVCLEESFSSFAERGEPMVWQYDTEFPSSIIVKHWLLGRLFVALHQQ